MSAVASAYTTHYLEEVNKARNGAAPAVEPKGAVRIQRWLQSGAHPIQHD
jgi:hypothetical protein